MDAWRITVRGLPGTVLAGFFCVFSIVQVEAGGYLARTGPVPIRFQPVIENTNSALPALKLNVPETSTYSNLPQPAATETTTNLTYSEPKADTNSLTTDTNVFALEPIPAPSETGPEAQAPTAGNEPILVTPQMLVELFAPIAGFTNGAVGTITLPVEARFNPPEPRKRSESKAVYSSK